MDWRHAAIGVLFVIAVYVLLSSPPKVSSCERLGVEEKNRCYTNLALEKEDTSFCGSIPDQVARDSCLKGVAVDKQDIGVCGSFSDLRQRDSCVKEVARARNDSSLCPTISDVAIRDECFSWIAVQRVDASICESVSSENRDPCLSDVALLRGET